MQQCQIEDCPNDAKVRIKFMFSVKTPTDEVSNIGAWMPLCQDHSSFAFGCTIPLVWTSEVERITVTAENLIEQGRPNLSIVDPDDEC